MKFDVTDNPGKAWEAFAEKHADTPFGSFRWSKVVKEGLKGEPLWFILKNGTEIVGGMAGVLLKHGGIRLLYCSIPYGGYLGDKRHFGLFMDAFCAETGFADIIYLSPYDSDPSLGYAGMFTAHPETVTRIDLRGKDLQEVQSCYAPSVRQSLNKGVRLGLRVECRRDRSSFVVAHRLYLETMRRNNAIARYPQRWFAAICDHLAIIGEACVYLVFSGDMPISATVVVDSPKTKHLLHSGASTEHLSLRANDLVVCEIIREAFRGGAETVDFMFSDPKDLPLIGWKEKFGGQSFEVNKYRKINSPLKHALWQGAKKVAPLFGRVGVRSGSTRL